MNEKRFKSNAQQLQCEQLPPAPLSTYKQLPVWEVADDNDDGAVDDVHVLLIPQT